jgi:hypothetical protein
MNVGLVNRQEKYKMQWEHNLPRKAFGNILMTKIFMQQIWN